MNNGFRRSFMLQLRTASATVQGECAIWTTYIWRDLGGGGRRDQRSLELHHDPSLGTHLALAE